MLHTTIVLSSDPEAKLYPLGENTTLLTIPLWPLRLLTNSPVGTFQIPIVLSSDPEAKYSPFGENDTVRTKPLWPRRVFISYPV